MKYRVKSPVVLIIYKRPELVKKTFNAIKKVRPKKLYVIADGPKNDQEKNLTKETRDIIREMDWECNVKKIYSKKNLGLRERIVTGLNEVFMEEKQAIILEDDCLASTSFFKFCDTMLERYKDKVNVFSVSGTNFTSKNYKINESYYFSKYPQVWGWATWKRAWDKYDKYMEKWNKTQKNKFLQNIFSSEDIVDYWRHVFNMVKKGEIKTWDYQWVFTHFFYNSASIIPSVNMIRNIGINNQATHTKKENYNIDNKIKEMIFPLIHPAKDAWRDDIDYWYEKNVFITFRLVVILRIKRHINKILKKFNKENEQ